MEKKQLSVYEALPLAQAEFPAIKFDGKNPHFKSEYATLGNILNAITPPLNKYGFFIAQPICNEGPTQLKLTTMIYHSSGAAIELGSSIIDVTGKKPQEVGSFITYMKRYQISSAFGICGDKDDDGEAAMGISAQQVIARSEPNLARSSEPTLDKHQVDHLKNLLKERMQIREFLLDEMDVELVSEIKQKDYTKVLKLIHDKINEGAA